MKAIILCVWALVHLSLANNTDFVNLFIGTQGSRPGTSYNGGNVFPGASRPFGAVKVGIDTAVFDLDIDANVGYTPDGNVTAITLLHESGTGGSPTYGLVPQMPLTSLEGVNLLDNLTYMQPRLANDTAEVGYYATSLANGVLAEMAASLHSGLMQYTFTGNTNRYVLVDLSHYLPAQGGGSEQKYRNGRIEISEHGSQYSGYVVNREGWTKVPDNAVYFCGRFETPPQTAQLFSGAYTDPYWVNGTVPGSRPHPTPDFTNATVLTGSEKPWYRYPKRIGALFEFHPNITTLRSKVGVSWISEELACSHLDEIRDFDMPNTRSESKTVWNTDVMSKIRINDRSNLTRLEMFYSGLYRAHLLPSNRTGENPNWKSSEPYFDDFYAIWDTFRCLNSFYLLIAPSLAESIVRSLIDIWRNERFMPDGRSGNYNGGVQGGSDADNVLADAYVKGLRGGINWTDGYLAMKTDAEQVPYNTFDPGDLSGSTREGRGALPDWLEYGFVTPDFGRSISRTIEYSLNDFSLYQVAQGEAPRDAAKYLSRSAGWQRIWVDDITSLNFTGFPAPQYGNGTVMPGYDPLDCGSCDKSGIAYEASPWEYSFTVPFDMKTLIEKMGGPATTEARLDVMFVPRKKNTEADEKDDNGIGTSIYNPGNEPSFATPFLYNYLQGRQYKSVQRSREILDRFYNTGPSGLPGNDDAGALSSWMMWNMLGLYPVVTQPVYLLLSPWFSDVEMSVGGNSTLRITAQGLNGTKGSYYVQSVKVNGRSWNQSWVSHDDLVGGGIDGKGATIEFELGAEKTEWDVGALPPSPGHFEI